jgi:hypothetical protein
MPIKRVTTKQDLTIDEARTRLTLVKEAQRQAFEEELSICINVIRTHITHPNARRRIQSSLIRRMAESLLILAENERKEGLD